MIRKFSLDYVFDFVNSYMLQIVYGAVFVVILSIGVVFYQKQQEKQINDYVVKYYEAVKLIDTDREKSIKIFDEVFGSVSDTNLKMIFGMRLAELQKSPDIYLKIFSMDSDNLFLRNLAGLNALSILVNQNENEKVENLLTKLKRPDNPLFILVSEQEGLFELQRGNETKAKEIFTDILSQDIDEFLRQRIDNLNIL
ncbi:MAG: hypothetical protein LBH46_03885 [Rickettsiales bacterium]|nr:hypothetical protein [Rickettsiales bacterium]